MSDRWPGGIISGTPPVPTGGGAQDSAPGIWTMEQASPYIAAGNWPGMGTPDPQFQYVTALLHGDGTNAGQNNTFIDSSPNNFTITRNGNTTQGSFSPYGDLWSNFQPNIASDFLSFSTGSGTSFQFPGDFTIEAWVLFPTSTNTDHSLYVSSPNNNDYFALNIAMDTGLYNLYLNSTGISSSISSGIPVGQWTHVAMVRSGSTITMYTNGSPRGTVSNSSTLGYASPILNRNGGGGPSSGQRYVSNLRIVKGTAVYTSAFTPSTTPLTAISGTSVLICQSNRFVDNSSNNFAITVGGTPSVQRFSPFQNLATYTTARVGGSGYFDGSGDFLSVPANAAWNLANNSFTIECWSYPTAAQSDKHLFSLNDSGGTGFWVLRYNTGTTPQFIYNNYSLSLTSSTAATINQWNHIAVSSNGSTISLYLNGVRVATSSSTTITNGSANPLIIGSQLNVDRAITGYVSDARVVNGSAIYNPSQSTLTVPTAPLTNVTNTSLLANFTNAAIFDSDASNDFETVGNAQISTSVVKYGTGSIALDGSGDYLKSNAATADLYAFGTGNFTIEFWLYLNSSASGQIIYDSRPSGTNTTQPTIYIGGSTVLYYYTNSINAITGPSLVTSTWYHIAVSRVGTSTRMFLNGNQVGSTYSDSTNYTNTAFRPFIGADAVSDGAQNYVNGYIDDLRITKGYARYWYNFQPPTRAFPNYGGTVIEMEDPLFEYNTLLLNGDGANGGQNNTFLDSSTNNFTITRNGNTTQGSFSPYGTLWSNYFNGSSNLALGSNAAFQPGTGDFTIEAWVNFSANNSMIIAVFSSGVAFYVKSTGFLAVAQDAVAELLAASTPFPLNQWTHVAVVRSGTTLTLYQNGQPVGSTSNSNNFTGSTVTVGSGQSLTQPSTGYISNFRFVKGTAVYTAAFTPSTAPLTAISGTSLLTCQSNRFIDNSTNAFAISTNGTPQVQRFSPFEPSAPYSTSVIGGSGYFDGNADYLQLTETLNAAGTFTIEGWFCPTSLSYSVGNYGCIFATNSSYPTTGVSLFLQNNGTLSFWYNGTNNIATTTISINQWYHFALVSTGSTFNAYLNGALLGSTSASTTNGNQITTIGAAVSGVSWNNNFYFIGYISDVRATNTQVYTGSTYTIPTAPLAAISGTNFLTSMQNAAIPDYAMQNDLETVGNAQISTSVVKYGTGSIYFDGNGDGLVTASNPAVSAFSGNFTVEGWVYPTLTQFFMFWTNSQSNSDGLTAGYIYTTGQVGIGKIGVNELTTATGVVQSNTWTHIAFVGFNGTVTIYVNGNPLASGTQSTFVTSTVRPMTLGRNYQNTPQFALGYVDDFRVTYGLARYVQPFTPPTAALPTY